MYCTQTLTDISACKRVVSNTRYVVILFYYLFHLILIFIIIIYYVFVRPMDECVCVCAVDKWIFIWSRFVSFPRRECFSVHIMQAKHGILYIIIYLKSWNMHIYIVMILYISVFYIIIRKTNMSKTNVTLLLDCAVRGNPRSPPDVADRLWSFPPKYVVS